MDEASWISSPHHSHLAVPHDPHDTPNVTPAPRSVATGRPPTGWPGASWLPPQDQKWSDKRWASAEQSSQLTSTKAGRPLSLHTSLHLNQQWRVAVALSSPQILPPSPLQSYHSLLDVLQSCLGTRISAEKNQQTQLFNFIFFCKLIFCYFNMLKWLGKGHDKAWQRTATREGQEQNAQGKGSERAFFFKKYLLYKLEYIWSKGAESRTVDSSQIGLGCHWTSGSTRWTHGGIP